MAVKIMYHGQCFDGAASAALFARLYQGAFDPKAEFAFEGRMHRTGRPFESESFSEAVNAVVDFRYSPDERLTWWIDHHPTTFVHAEDQRHFESRVWETRFLDVEAPSCAGLIARLAKSRFGVDMTAHQELIAWAEMIDAARFPDARMAVSVREPALRLMTWLEGDGDPVVTTSVIRQMLEGRSFEDILTIPEIEASLRPLLRAHETRIEEIREKARVEGDIVFFDLCGNGAINFNKFIPYDLFPQAVYSIGVTASAKKTKVSVGSNPWRQDQRRHPIHALCEAHGGGGHPAVGAVSLPQGEIDRARQIAASLLRALQAEPLSPAGAPTSASSIS